MRVLDSLRTEIRRQKVIPLHSLPQRVLCCGDDLFEVIKVQTLLSRLTS